MRKPYYLTEEQLKILPNCNSCWRKTYKYAKLMESGIEFPPVNIFFNKDKNRWEYNDGRNRVMASKLSGVPLKVKSSKRMGYGKII